MSWITLFSLEGLLCTMEDVRLPRKARSDPFAYFSRHGPYSMQGNDEIFAAAGKYSDMVGPDVRLNERLHAAAKKGKRGNAFAASRAFGIHACGTSSTMRRHSPGPCSKRNWLSFICV